MCLSRPGGAWSTSSRLKDLWSLARGRTDSSVSVAGAHVEENARCFARLFPAQPVYRKRLDRKHRCGYSDSRRAHFRPRIASEKYRYFFPRGRLSHPSAPALEMNARRMEFRVFRHFSRSESLISAFNSGKQSNGCVRARARAHTHEAIFSPPSFLKYFSRDCHTRRFARRLTRLPEFIVREFGVNKRKTRRFNARICVMQEGARARTTKRTIGNLFPGT